MNKKSLVLSLFLVSIVLFGGCQSTNESIPAPKAGSIPAENTGRFVFEGTYFSVLDIFSDGTYYFNDNRTDYYSGGIVRKANDIFTFYETFGPCANQTGKYRWQPKNNGFLLIWVEDTCTNRVHLFTEVFYVKVPTAYPYIEYIWKTLTLNTSYLAMDTNGNIFVTDGTKGVHEFSSDGKIVKSWGDFTNASGIAVAKSGNVYVVDRTELAIEKYDASGNLITAWKTQSQVFGPGDVAVDDAENVYVSLQNPQSHYIEKFDSDGNFLGAWASQGNGDGQAFAQGKLGPVEIAVDANGTQYLTDPLNNRIVKFDSEGNFMGNLTGGGSDLFVNPRYVTLDPSGNLYVLDVSQSIWKFDSAGGFIGHWFTPSWGSIAADKNGNVVIADYLQIVKVRLP